MFKILLLLVTCFSVLSADYFKSPLPGTTYFTQTHIDSAITETIVIHNALTVGEYYANKDNRVLIDSIILKQNNQFRITDTTGVAGDFWTGSIYYNAISWTISDTSGNEAHMIWTIDRTGQTTYSWNAWDSLGGFLSEGTGMFAVDSTGKLTMSQTTGGSGYFTVSPMGGSYPITVDLPSAGINILSSSELFRPTVSGAALEIDSALFVYDTDLTMIKYNKDMVIVITFTPDTTDTVRDTMVIYQRIHDMMDTVVFELLAGTGNDSLIPVTLSSFTAVSNGSVTRIAWSTVSETECLGWNVYRDENGVRTRINMGLIPGGGTTNIHQTYEIVDPAGATHNCFYVLEQIDITGSKTIYMTEAQTPTGINLSPLSQIRNTPNVKYFSINGRQIGKTDKFYFIKNGKTVRFFNGYAN